MIDQWPSQLPGLTWAVCASLTLVWLLVCLHMSVCVCMHMHMCACANMCALLQRTGSRRPGISEVPLNDVSGVVSLNLQKKSWGEGVSENARPLGLSPE